MYSCICKNFYRRILQESFIKNKDILTYLQIRKTKQCSNNLKKKYSNEENPPNNDHNLTAIINTKYRIFQDKDADVILDVSEEQQKINLNALNIQEPHDLYTNINLNRGTSGVFDIEDLIVLLKKDKAKNIFVASVPKNYAYVDYIVIATGKSQKHMSALATFVRKIYKLKRHKSDLIPRIEGENSKDWMALDLGNIALHIFSESSRDHYDLETLWTIGLQYDDKINKPKESDIMDQYNAFLVDLYPANDS